MKTTSASRLFWYLFLIVCITVANSSSNNDKQKKRLKLRRTRLPQSKEDEEPPKEDQTEEPSHFSYSSWDPRPYLEPNFNHIYMDFGTRETSTEENVASNEEEMVRKPYYPRHYGKKPPKKEAVACLPKVERECKHVMRKVSTITTHQRCFEVPQVTCEEENASVNMDVCSNAYGMDKKHTTARVTKIQRSTECTKLTSENYKATFCFYIPSVGTREVGATLVFPTIEESCEKVQIVNPSADCNLDTRMQCIDEPVVEEQMVMVMECTVSQESKECTKLPPLKKE